IALVHEAGGCAIVHSDDASGIQRLNQEAAKVLRAANEAGMGITYEDAIRWITINPAKALGIDVLPGAPARGKMADVVGWSGDPFSVSTRAEKVFIDGALVLARTVPSVQPMSDLLLGTARKELLSRGALPLHPPRRSCSRARALP